MARSDKKKYGSAVENTVLRYLSASSLTAFSPDQDGGCNRRWHFEKIQHKKQEEQTWQRIGTDGHVEAAHYLASGEDVLGRVMRSGKHFMPSPGKDLIIEQGFGDFDAAIKARDAVIAGTGTTADVEKLCLAVLGVPVMGEMDLRHRRGEWVANDGTIHREADPEHTAEVFDHKTTSDLKWAKTEYGLLKTIQMPLYAKATVFDWPDIHTVRISHGVYCTGKTEARKTTTLLHLPVIDERFHAIENQVRTMMDVAKETDIAKVDANLSSCGAFKGCPFSSICPKTPAQLVVDLIGTTAAKSLFSTVTNTSLDALRQELIQEPIHKGATMSLFDTLKNPVPANGTVVAPPVLSVVPQVPHITVAPPAVAVPTPAVAPPAPPVEDPQTRALIEANKANLAAEDARAAQSFGFCSACGSALNTLNISRLQDGTTRHIGCTKAANANGSFASVLPPDAPASDPVKRAIPVPPETLVAMPEGPVKTAAAAHAALAAAAAPALPVAEPKTSGRCLGGKDKIALTVDMVMAKKMVCSVCSKEVRLKPFKEGDAWFAEPTHNMPKTEALPTPAAPTIAAPAITPPPPVVAVPAVAAFVPAVPVNIKIEGDDGVMRPFEFIDNSKPAHTAPVVPHVVAPVAPHVPPVVVAPPAPVAPPVVAATANAEFVLFVDVIVAGKTAGTPLDLESYYLPIVRQLEAACGATDIRSAPQDSALGYSKWKGVLAASLRAMPPQSGTYIVRDVKESEVKQVVVETLRPMADFFMRGV